MACVPGTPALGADTRGRREFAGQHAQPKPPTTGSSVRNPVSKEQEEKTEGMRHPAPAPLCTAVGVHTTCMQAPWIQSTSTKRKDVGNNPS